MVATGQLHPLSTALGVLAGTRPLGPDLGLYLHVPFCTKKCHFCSFNSAVMDHRAMADYLEALHREIALVAAAPWARTVALASVFLGGGTPSLLSAASMAGILDDVRARFRVAPDAEVTVESNPENLDRDTLAGYRAAGVTRLSLGVQTLENRLLPGLGRLHDAEDARRAFDAARAAGFDNVSVDLMYGLPGLGLAQWRASIQGVLSWMPDHLSAYGLTLDAGSTWASTGVRGLPDEDVVVAQYWALAEAAAARGYEHYEISNYARPGRRSRHNQIYWRRREYLALGPGACGFVGDVRYANVKPVSRYASLLAEGRLPIDTSERVDADQALAEQLFLGLRTSDGVGPEVLERRVAAVPALGARVDAWIADGLMLRGAGRVRLTERGFLVSDALFVELV